MVSGLSLTLARCCSSSVPPVAARPRFLALDKFAALKAIGVKGRELTYMILFMATFTALTGYGLGIGLVTLIISIARSRLPNYAAMITFWNLGLSFGIVLLIAAISSYIGIRKVLKIEPFDIFRG
jgi:putative ABC transport system permease protein